MINNLSEKLQLMLKDFHVFLKKISMVKKDAFLKSEAM